MTPRFPFAAALFLLLLAPLCACGGGGGGSFDPAVLVAGDFSAHSFDASQSAVLGPEHTSTWGMLQPDGVGGLTGTYRENVDGVLDGPWIYPLLTFDVAPDRTFTLRDKFGQPAGLGGASSTGDVVAFADVRDGAFPRMSLWVRQGDGFTNADFSGDWYIAIFGWATSTTFSVTMQVTADGAGGLAVVGGKDIGGTVTPIGSSGSYSVAPDGSFDMSVDIGGAGLALTGQLSTDRMVLSLAGGPGGFYTFLGAGIQLGSGRSDATLTGEYFLVGMDEDSGDFIGFTGTATADGAGTLDIGALTQNDESVIGTSSPFAQSYAVLADGGFTLGTAAGFGCVSADGRIAVLGDGALALAGGPYLVVLIRK